MLQKEFVRIDKDKSGTISADELSQMTHTGLSKDAQILWQEVIDASDQNGDGVIDFEEFVSACIDRQVLSNIQSIKRAFSILDVNKDGKISLDDVNDLFSSYGGTVDYAELWDQLLAEADTNHDGAISYEEF